MTYQPILTLRGHTSTVYAVAFGRRAGQTLLASGSFDSTVKLWDLEKGRESTTINGHNASVSALAFFLRRDWLVTGSNDHRVKLWRLFTLNFRQMVAALRAQSDGHAGAIYSVTYTPDERWLISAGTDNAVRLVDLSRPRDPVIWLRGHTGHIYQVAVSADGRWLASGSMDNTIRLWDLAAILARGTVEPLIVLRGHTDGVTSVVFAPDGSKLASGSYDGTVRLWDMRFVPDDLTLLRYPAPVTLRYHRDCVQCLAFSPDGTRLASASSDRTVRVYRMDEPRPYQIATLARHLDKVHTVNFSADGKLIASGSKDQTVIVWGD